MELKRIASYLAWNFPPYYQAPFDKAIFVKALRAISKDVIKKEDTDEIREYAKNDEEIFFMWLNRLSEINEELLNDFFSTLKLDIPWEVMYMNWGYLWKPSNKIEFENILDSLDEIPATEEIIWPILCNFFEVIGPRGHKIKHGEWWQDLHTIAYKVPFWMLYLGIQVKKWDIWEAWLFGDWKIFNQLETAMSVAKIATDWERIKPNELMLIVSWKMHEEPRLKLIEKWNEAFPNSRLVIWDREELYQQALKYWLPQKPTTQSTKKRPPK